MQWVKTEQARGGAPLAAPLPSENAVRPHFLSQDLLFDLYGAIVEPVRMEAQVDPRLADRLQPPYPLSEQGAGNEGIVKVRVRIGADGGVVSVEQVAAASDAFFEVT